MTTSTPPSAKSDCRSGLLEKCLGLRPASSSSRQAVLQSCNSLPAHISAYQPPCHPSLSLTLFLQLFSNWLHPGSHHRCPRLCGRWSGGTGWVWLRRQHSRLFVHNKTLISQHLETLHRTTLDITTSRGKPAYGKIFVHNTISKDKNPFHPFL